MPLIAMLLLLVARVVCAAPDEAGLVACWDFDEGEGTVLHDRTGNGNDGTVHGASWVRVGTGSALRFDGQDDTVDCGTGASLGLTSAATLEAWVFPEAIPGSGEAGIVGKDFASYSLTYYVDGQCWWYISGGGNNCKAAVSPGAWHHVVGSFDGQVLRLYVDGVLAASQQTKSPTIGAGKAFLMGASAGDAEYTRGAHFKGMLDEVRVYGRALSADEIATHYRTTRLTGEIALRPTVYAFSRSVVAWMDLRGLGELPAGAKARLALRQAAASAPLQALEVALAPTQLQTEATFRVPAPVPGDYEITAQALGPDGAPIGKPSTCALRWPQTPVWKTAPQARVLNNLVTELLDVKSPPVRSRLEFAFANPRDGWVYIAAGAFAGPAAPVDVLVDGKCVQTLEDLETHESMTRLPAGPHGLSVGARGGGMLDRITVRAIPELVYACFGADPHVTEYGKYDWEFLGKHVLPNINVMVGSGNRGQMPYLELWKQQGKQWFVQCGVPGIGAQPVPTSDQAERYWSTHQGMADPRFDGVIADEFGSGEGPRYAAWTAAVRRMGKSEALATKSFYPYCGPMFGATGSREFIQAVMDAGWRFACERYLPEQRTAIAARAYLQGTLSRSIEEWRTVMPGAENHMIVCLGDFSQPPESLDVDPGVNYKAYLDMQFNLLANDPACFGLYGVMSYLSSYADEETVRWMGKLFRHYCIEGRSTPLTADPYALSHIQNPDFEQGLLGWSVSPAEGGGIEARTMEGFSWLQGRYPRTSQGNTVLWMKRSATRPNTVSQTVRGLQPGRLYSARMFSADYRDLSVKQKHALTLRVTNAEVQTGISFQHVFANCYSHHEGRFDATTRAWMNYHWVVFRAKGPEAQLAISDWSGETEAGGPAEQELAVNFVEVQPYDAP